MDEKLFAEQERQAVRLEQAIAEQIRWASQAHRGAAKKARAMEVEKGGKVFYRAKAKKIDRCVKSNVKRLHELIIFKQLKIRVISD